MLVDSGETKGYVIQTDQVDLVTAYLDTVDETESYLIYSWTKRYDFEAPCWSWTKSDIPDITSRSAEMQVPLKRILRHYLH